MVKQLDPTIKQQKHVIFYTLGIIFNNSGAYMPRALFSSASTFFLLYGLKNMSMFNALVILNTAPFLLPFLRKILYKKNFPQSIYIAIGTAFLGIILILAPDQGLFSKSFLIIFASMVCLSCSLLMLENPKLVDSKLIIFYYFAVSSLLSSTYLIFNTPPLFQINSLVLAGITGLLLFVVQWSIVFAARFISALLISILFYSEIIMSLIGSVWFENFTPSSIHYLGSIFILLGGFAVAWLENTKA